MFCSLSGEPVKDPVISPKSGRIFEKKLIVSYLSTNNTDPISDDPLSIDELVPVNNDTSKTIVPPKPPAFNSIPALLSTFQNEFDAMALEVFSLRKQLLKAKQELSSALYQYDAAVKVAANAIKERDEANQALQQLTLSIGSDVMDQEDEQIEEQKEEANGDSNGDQVPVPVDAINDARQDLFQLHKSQKISLPASSLDISVKDAHSIKKYNHHYFDDDSHTLLINGGKELTVTDLVANSEEKVTHRGAVVAVSLVEHDGASVPVYATKKQVKVHDTTLKFQDDVISIVPHPKLKTVFVVVCKHSWTLIVDGHKSISVEIEGEATTAQFHVDGALFGVGTAAGNSLIYNVTDGSLAASLACAYQVVDKLQFGLNGYWLIASSHDSSTAAVQVFDLRKQTTVHTIEVPQLNDFAVDGSCSLILTATDDGLTVHRFFKKEKAWTDGYLTFEDIKAKHIIITDQAPDAISVVGLAGTKRTHFELVFTGN